MDAAQLDEYLVKGVLRMVLENVLQSVYNVEKFRKQIYGTRKEESIC